MQHRGEIVRKAVYESGISITKLAEKLGKSRRWVYQMFENSNVSIDMVLQIGEILHHDFSGEIKELQKHGVLSDQKQTYELTDKEVEYWKNKYLILLEEYNQLLKDTKN